MSRSNYLEKEIAHNGHTIKIYRDEDAESPREWDNLGIIYSNHRRWNPDGKGINDLIREVGGNIYEDTIPFDLIAKTHYFLKVWMYDHSGQTIKVADHNPFNDPWDSGLAGVIAVSKEKAKKEYGYKRACKSLEKRVAICLTGEIKTFDQFMQGDVWGYTVEDENGNETDSCWGYYDIAEAVLEAQDIIDYQAEHNQ